MPLRQTQSQTQVARVTPGAMRWLIAVLLAMLPSAAFAQEPPAAPAEEADKPAEARPAEDKAADEKPADEPGKPRSALSRELAEQGEADLFSSVRVFQQRYLLKARRVELLFGGGATLNDPMVRHSQVDAGLVFHITERWAVGLGGAKYFSDTTDTFNSIQADYGLFPERSALQAGGWAEVQFSPVFGKFSSFGLAVLQVDGYLVAAGGAVRTSRSDALKPAGQLGVGLRVHTLRWLTLSAELRDMGFVESFQQCIPGKSIGPCGDLFLQHVSVGLRLGLWLPPTVTYRYQR